MEAGLELLKALTERGNGRLKNLDARLEELDGQIREQAAYMEKVRQNGKRKKELEERKKEREQFLPVLQAAAGAWEEAKRSGDAVPELDRVIQECTEWERQYGSLEQDQSRLAEMDRSREEEAGGLECLLKRQAELDQELLAEKGRSVHSLKQMENGNVCWDVRQDSRTEGTDLEGKFSQWKEVRERLAGNRERLSRLLEQEAGERERKDVLSRASWKWRERRHGAAMVLRQNAAQSRGGSWTFWTGGSGTGRKGCAGQRIPGSRLGGSGRLLRRINLP